MPFLPFLDEEQKKKTVPGEQVNISGSSTTINKAAQNIAAPKPVQRSGSWTNLSAYLDANKEQAGEMADKVTGDIDSDAQNASTKIDGVKVAAPTVPLVETEDTLSTKFFTNPDPSKKAVFDDFKKTGGYKGPDDIHGISGYDDTVTATGKAVNKVEQSKTEGGRQTLLTDRYNRPTYSQGEKVFDNLLVQNDPTSKTKFERVQGRWSGLAKVLDDTTAFVNDKITTGKGNAQKNRELLPGAETKAVEGILSPIRTRVDTANKDNPALVDRVTEDLKDGVLSTETLGLLGITPGQHTYGLNPSNYLTTDKTPLTVNNAATPEERKRYGDLMALLGIDAVDITQDGQAINPVKFDKDKFLADTAARGQQYNTEYNTVKRPFTYTMRNIDGEVVGIKTINVTPRELRENYLGKGYFLPAAEAELEQQFGQWEANFNPNSVLTQG